MKPREKFLKYGCTKLEGRELIATMLGSGSTGADIFSISKKAHALIEQKGVGITQQDLENIKGIGPLKAMQLVSGFELARRYFVTDHISIKCSQDILDHVHAYRTKQQEYLLCITLDGAYHMIQKHIITIGTLTQSLVHPREVFAPAIEERAHSIILVHNHPSGNIEPSKEDRAVTQRIKEVGDLVGIHLLDHLIVTKHEYWSFKEQGVL